MDIFKQFATDSNLEQDGTWINLGGGAKILVARAGNKKYGRLLGSAVDKNRTVLDSKTDEADDVSDQILIDVLAESILLGWEGITYKNKPMAYSLDNAKILLAIPDFRATVTAHSKNVDHFRVAAEAITEKK
jgi:hypothetical protein